VVHINELMIQSDIFVTLLTTKWCRNLGTYREMWFWNPFQWIVNKKLWSVGNIKIDGYVERFIGNKFH